MEGRESQLSCPNEEGWFGPLKSDARSNLWHLWWYFSGPSLGGGEHTGAGCQYRGYNGRANRRRRSTPDLSGLPACRMGARREVFYVGVARSSRYGIRQNARDST